MIREGADIGAQHRRDGVGGVPRLFCNDPRAVPLLTGGVQVEGSDPPLESAECSCHEGWQHVIRGQARLRGQRGSAYTVHEVGEQGAIPRGVHDRARGPGGGDHALLQDAIYDGSRSRGILGAEGLRVDIEALLEDLGIACLTQPGRHPTKFLAQAPRPLVIDQRAEDLEPAAQSARADAHLVHGIGQIPTQPQISAHQPARVQGQVGAHDIAGGIVCVRPGQLGDIRWRQRTGTEGSTHLAHGAGLRTRGHEMVRHSIEEVLIQTAVVAREGLDLDLAETHRHALPIEDRDGVIDDLRASDPCGVDEEPGCAMCDQGRDRSQRCFTNEGRHQVGECIGQLRRDGSPELIPGTRRCRIHREFEMPARIGAALSQAQGDAPAEEPQIECVVVGVAHGEGWLGLHTRDAIDRGEIRQRESRGYAQFAFDLAMGLGHTGLAGSSVTPDDRGCGGPRSASPGDPAEAHHRVRSYGAPMTRQVANPRRRCWGRTPG